MHRGGRRRRRQSAVVITPTAGARTLKDGTVVNLQLRVRRTGRFAVLLEGRDVPVVPAAEDAPAAPAAPATPAERDPLEAAGALANDGGDADDGARTPQPRHRWTDAATAVLSDLHKCLRETAADGWETVRARARACAAVHGRLQQRRDAAGPAAAGGAGRRSGRRAA